MILPPPIPPPALEMLETHDNKPLLKLPSGGKRGPPAKTSRKPDPILEKGMKGRHFAFCREYVVDHNGKRAAMACGWSAVSAALQASRMLSRSDIQAEIARLTAITVQRLELTAESIDRELMRIAFYDVKADIEKFGRCWMKATDKIRALELLGRRLNLFQDQVQLDVMVLSDEQRLERATALEGKVKARILALRAERAGPLVEAED